MIAPSTQELAALPEVPASAAGQLRADHISKRGRALTVAVFGVTIAALLLTFGWIGARRVNSIYTSWGDAAMQARDYQAAAGDYTWAIRFSWGDAHAIISRGYARQQL